MRDWDVLQSPNFRTHRPVFIKQLLTQYYQNPGTNQNDCEMYWTREQKILQLQSASPVSTIHILGAISLITTQNPEYYFILDYLNAPTLEGWVSKQYLPEKSLHLRDYKIFLSSSFLPLVDHLNFIYQQGNYLPRFIGQEYFSFTTRESLFRSFLTGV